MITIYGSPRSSAGRCFWCLEEVGVDYDAKIINFAEKEHQSEDFLKLNPSGKVPVLTDGEFSIWESMAINFYLATAYKPELLGKDAKAKGLVQQWSYWAIAELQPPLIDIFIQLVFVPEERRDSKLIEKAQGKLPKLLATLELDLDKKSYLVNNEFSLADLNAASVVRLCKDINFDLSNYKNIQTWLERVSQRPSFQRYHALCKS